MSVASLSCSTLQTRKNTSATSEGTARCPAAFAFAADVGADAEGEVAAVEADDLGDAQSGLDGECHQGTVAAAFPAVPWTLMASPTLRPLAANNTQVKRSGWKFQSVVQARVKTSRKPRQAFHSRGTVRMSGEARPNSTEIEARVGGSGASLATSAENSVGDALEAAREANLLAYGWLAHQ